MEKFTTEVAAAARAFFEGEEVKAVIETTTKAADTETGTFEVVITTENLDRYQEVISLDGWELEHYLKNPVVLWGHDHSKLIGVATSLEKRDGQLVAKGKFAPTVEGQEKRQLYEMGFLKATSVGFIVKEQQGNLITKAELLEFSFVSVPANPYALSLAMEREMSINELVTKGIFTIKEAPAVVEEPGEVPAADEEDVVDPPEPTEKQFSSKTIVPLVQQLRGVVSALEALGIEEPERAEDEPEAETEEDAGLKDFSEKRKTLQDAATILGEVLAEARQAMEARR